MFHSSIKPVNVLTRTICQKNWGGQDSSTFRFDWCSGKKMSAFILKFNKYEDSKTIAHNLFLLHTFSHVEYIQHIKLLNENIISTKPRRRYWQSYRQDDDKEGNNKMMTIMKKKETKMIIKILKYRSNKYIFVMSAIS